MPRQVGKTTLVSEALKHRKMVLLNFDVPYDVSRFKAASVLPPADGMESLGSPEILVIDEAQRVPETARIVKDWYDSKLPVKFVLLGSSSLSLLSQSSESLTGRNHKILYATADDAGSFASGRLVPPGIYLADY